MYLYGIEMRYRTIEIGRNEGSNCTFMELKYEFSRSAIQKQNVLIVPLWNWNIDIVWSNDGTEGSNCTFMELKLVCNDIEWGKMYVLIVPLWNWNVFLRPLLCSLEVLIVPLWNWNNYLKPGARRLRLF